MRLPTFLVYPLLVMMGIAIGFFGTLVFSEPVPPTCETFALGASDPYVGTVYFGTIELCGQNLEWGRVKSPMSTNQGAW